MDQKKIDEIESIVVSRNYECPVCGKPFENYSLRSSKLKLVDSDTDLKASYEPYDPMYYDIVICSHCGYSSPSALFATINDRQADVIGAYLAGKFKHREYPKVYTPNHAVDRYKMALISATAKKAKAGEIANICLKLSWVYRDIGDKINESKFRVYAIESFQKAYETEEFPIASMDVHTLNYMLADLLRREGNLQDSQRYVGMVIIEKEITPRLRERAENLRELLKELIV